MRPWISWHSETVPPAWCPYHRYEELKKKTCGSSEKILVHWKESNVVTMATSAAEKYSEVPVNRWNKEEKADEKYSRVYVYAHIQPKHGGVDLHDVQVSSYRATIRSNKWWWWWWWWPVCSWCLHSVVVNSWLFFRDVTGSEYDLWPPGLSAMCPWVSFS